MREFIIAALVTGLYRILQLTWRLEVREPEAMRSLTAEGKPFIMAHWHGDEIVLLQLVRKYRAATIVSTSKDGEIMNQVFRWAGGNTTRGSSTRGAVGALKGLFKLVQQGWRCSFAVDGPKGPIYKVKPGVFEFSKRLNLPIFTPGIHCDRAFLFPKSWNKTYLPKPFAKITVEWTGPWGPVPEELDSRDPQLALDLEKQLFAAKDSASKSFAVNPQVS